MDPVNISYRIRLNDNTTEVFDFHLDGENFDLIVKDSSEPPAWTRLDYRQCSHCPLNSEEHPHCPLALQMHNIVSRFHHTHSIDEVEMEVITEERRIIQKTAIQRVIASMLELIYPSCGCPKTACMKPMARFHLPLSSEEETVFRVTGMYLLAQYFLSQTSRKGRIEFDGLTSIYNDMHTLNTAIASRLQSATQSDSAKNAITLVDMYSTLVPILLEDQLAEMRSFFKAYLPDDEEPVVKTNYLEKAKAFSMELELMPLDSQKKDNADDLPDWLKQAKGLLADEQKTTADSSKPVEKSSPFVTSSGLSLELAPIESEKAEEPTPQQPAAGASFQRTSSMGKAVFKLPDD